ncbi:MAG: hypothetical protein QOF18_289, partial [Frankiaceae bacterium]|nr:hypothetical protein [Frankiaceae bacterium]
MITDEMLERGLAAAAEDFEVPTGAVDRLREHIAPSAEPAARMRLRRPSRRAWIAIAATAAVVLVVLPFALGGGSSPANRLTTRPNAVGAPPSATGGNSAGSTSAHVPAVVASPAPYGASKSQRLADSSAGGSGSGAIGAGAAAPDLSFSQYSGKRLTPVPGVADRVIKTGELDLQVQKGQVAHTLDLLTGLANFEHGYVSDSRTTEGGYAPSGQVTLRVPVAVFDDAISRVRKFTGVKVLAVQTSGQDVTNKYVDVQARIKALGATRSVFLTLLSKANTIGETLAVQQHVTDVQTEIEQLQGQLKVLAARSSMSTLTVTVDQKVVQQVAPSKHHQSGIAKAFDRSVSRFVRGF